MNPRNCSLFLFAACLAGAAAAQDTLPAASAPDRRVHLDVQVANRAGAPSTELTQQDFSILDNKAAAPITSFHAEGGPQAPVEVILVIDAVNTSYTTVGYERGEIAKFLLANGGKLAHPTSLAVLTDKGMQVQPGFSQDGKLLNQALTQYTVGLRTILRSAGVYGAAERFDISLNALRLLAEREKTRPGRKLVLWMSPGWPLLSGPRIDLDAKQERQIFGTIVDLSARLREAHVTLYSVDPLGVQESVGRVFYYKQFVKGVSKPDQANLGNVALQVLAEQSGGLAVNSTDVNAMLAKCVADADSYYELTFDTRPAEHADEYHHIEVHVDKPGLDARTRMGYYDQP